MFNSGLNASGHIVSKKSSSLSGYAYGLQLQMYVGFNSNLTVFNSLFGKGGIIKVENGSYMSDDKLEGVFLSPGQSQAISIDRNFNFYLPKPYSNCDIANQNSQESMFNSNLFELIYHSNYEYTQQLCFSQCKFKKKDSFQF